VLPAGSTFVSAAPSQGTCSGTTTVTCSLGNIGPGASATITLSIELPRTRGQVTNTATVAAQNAETNPANNTSTAAIEIMEEIPALSPLSLALLALGLTFAALFVMRSQ